MKSWSIRLFLLLALLFSWGQPQNVFAHATDQPARVVFYLQNAEVQTGQIFQVAVGVEDVADLYGVDILVGFDPAVFEVLDADPVTPGVQISPRDDFLQPGIVLYQEADNLAGRVWYVVTQIYPAEPVSGTGVLFEFEMRALQEGLSWLDFVSTDLAGAGGLVIAHTSANAQVTVLGAGAQEKVIFLPVIVR